MQIKPERKIKMSYIEFDKTKPLDVIPIGRIAIDFNPTDMNKPLSESSNFNKYVGGSPANIAVGLARLGAKCGFIARVSDDQFGDYVENYFKADGIDVSHVFRCENGENLGLTFTEILSPTQSSILMYREGVADLQVCVDDVDEEYIKQAKAVVISGTALCASPSREEFDLTEAVEGVCASDEESAARWFSYGNKIVIIKHGKEGSVAYLDDGSAYKVKPFPVKMLKGFGGGDGYASAFIYSLLNGKSVPEALEFATASASMLVSAHSCSAAMPSAQAVQEFIDKTKPTSGEVIEKIK